MNRLFAVHRIAVATACGASKGGAEPAAKTAPASSRNRQKALPSWIWGILSPRGAT